MSCVYGAGILKSWVFFKDLCKPACPRVARADRHGHRALVTQSATHFVRSKKTHGLLRYRCRCAPPARDGHCPPRMDTWLGGYAKSKHGCCACAGMLPLPHGTHLHPSRVSACSAGTWSSADRLPHGGRHRRQRGRAAVLPVLPVLRAGASCRYRLRLGPQPTHMVTGSTRARPPRLRVRAYVCYVPKAKNPALYVL